ncbi:RagB/SusD family nutrient uptake outer membrane protein [uncultured Pontibacter sp.]|uniref:RagB/SusD family nutrient uptake outer membrane protein n=1 Tax=uncultured Pontibacter sp. TaxID=453356 RepID=UPI00263A3017|nr:RagB/SusD family nutrient uptake outer membrane protein [uncultured Pontibacter sp.]
MKIYKNLRYVALSLGLFMATTSCDDMLDVTPQDQLVADVALTTLSDFQLALNGIYSGMTSGSYYGTSWEVDIAYLGDNARRSLDNRGQGAELHNYTFASTNNEASAIWTTIYRVIDRANIVINRVDAVEGDQAVKNQIKGEALVARALAYHDLVRLYADRYDATADASHFGVPILLESKISEPGRNSVKEVYDQINADLVDAKGLMSNDAVGPNRFTDAAAAAIQARVALYQKQYQKAIDFATEAINAKGLANRTNFAAMWKQRPGMGESYFTLAMNATNPRVGELFYEINSNTAFMNPTQSLLNTFGQDDAETEGEDERTDDVRFSSYFTYTPGRAAGEYTITKYSDVDAQIKGLSNIHVIRAGEMYATRAEAFAALGNDPQALADLNALRSARIAGYEDVTLTGQELKDAIAEERRKELAYEGHRFFDLKRLNLALERGEDCSVAPASNCTIPAGNFRFTFPIPQDEIFANPTIGAQQNTGYLQ